MDINKVMQKIKPKHLCYALVFLSVLAVRMIAAGRLTATNDEAEIFINLSASAGEAGRSGSLLYQMLTKPLIALFGSSNLGMRFWVILSGALITLLPLLYEGILGKRTALILSILLALDPFQVASGILADGNALTLLALFAALGFFLKKKYGMGTISFTAFLFSGQHVQYGLALLFLAAIVAGMFELNHKTIKAIKDILQYNREKSAKLVVAAFLLFLLLLVLGISFSDVFSQLVLVLQNWYQPYAVGSYPQVFPLALLSYLPVCLITLYPAGQLGVKREVIASLYLGLLVMLLLVAFYPAHAAADLIWVSLPVNLLCAFKLNGLVEQYRGASKKIHIYTLLVSILLVSMAIHFGLLAYKLQYGINWIAELLSMTILLILTVMVVVFIAYIESVGLALNAAGAGLAILILGVQLAFAWRATGLNGNPAAETLWGGYFDGAQSVEGIIDNADLAILDSGLENKVVFLDYDYPAVEWALTQAYPAEETHFGLGQEQYAVVITESSTGLDGSAVDGYYGQDFVASSYPYWTWQPVRNLFTSDFWAWLIWRQNEQIHIYHYIWLNKNLFQ